MEQDLQSAISYAGGTTLQAIRKVDYVLVKNSIFNGEPLKSILHAKATGSPCGFFCIPFSLLIM